MLGGNLVLSIRIGELFSISRSRGYEQEQRGSYGGRLTIFGDSIEK